MYVQNARFYHAMHVPHHADVHKHPSFGHLSASHGRKTDP